MIPFVPALLLCCWLLRRLLLPLLLFQSPSSQFSVFWQFFPFFVEIHERFWNLCCSIIFSLIMPCIEYDYILWFSSVFLLHDLLRSSFCFFFVSHQVNDVFCSGSLSRFAKAWRKLATLEWIQEFVLCFFFSSSLATENDARRVFLMLKALRSSYVLFSCSED